MGQGQFPIPDSGPTVLIRRSLERFDVECSGVDTTENRLLQGFFCSMQGRFGEFRFEAFDMIYPKCRFDSDSVDFKSHGPHYDEWTVTFPIRILGPA